jgi:hypothetical protein
MENSENNYTKAQQGSGSAENRGDSRESQKAQYTQTDKDERKDLAEQAGLGRKRMSDLDELGALSGRDDYAGGSGDDMSNQSTNEETDR